MTDDLNVDLSQTPEKFHHIGETILASLTEMMLSLNKLEAAMFEATLPGKDANLMELWSEYGRACEDVIAPIRAKPKKKGDSHRSYGKPQAYAYLSNSSTKTELIMKSAKRALLEFHFEAVPGSFKYERFVFKNIEDEWKIDAKKCAFSKSGPWMKDQI